MPDDNELAAYDLGAWEVPPPSSGLADRVIARAKEPARRWWVGAAIVTVAAAVAFALWGGERAPQKPAIEEQRRVPTEKTTPPPESPACDATAILKKGDAQFSSGMFVAALATYEAAVECKSDLLSIRKAAMAACRAKNVAKARSWVAKIPEGQRDPLLQICLREGITLFGPAETPR